MIGITELSTTAWIIIGAVVFLFMAISWWSIRDAFSREFSSPNEKFLWLQISILIPFIGGIVYLLVGRKRGKKTT